MTIPVVFLREASADLAGALDWYESQRRGLGARLLDTVDSQIRIASEHPKRFPVLYSDYRKASLSPFPYLLVFRPHDDQLFVAAVWHGRRDPAELMDRLRG